MKLLIKTIASVAILLTASCTHINITKTGSGIFPPTQQATVQIRGTEPKDRKFDEVGMVDGFRVVNQEEEQYTWWSNRGQAWANNTGWRIDYQVISPALADKVISAEIYKDERYSDHSPLILSYDY